jgi:hypothetical protein
MTTSTLTKAQMGTRRTCEIDVDFTLSTRDLKASIVGRVAAVLMLMRVPPRNTLDTFLWSTTLFPERRKDCARDYCCCHHLSSESGSRFVLHGGTYPRNSTAHSVAAPRNIPSALLSAVGIERTKQKIPTPWPHTQCILASQAN